MTDRSVRVVLSAAVEQFVAGMKKAQGAADGLKAELREATQSEGWGKTTTAVAAVGAAAVAASGLAAKSFADFDKQMAAVRATGEEARESYTQLKDAAIQAGADTAFSASEAARGMEALLKAGVSAADVLDGGLNGALALAAAGELELGAAAEIASTALTQFKLSGQDVGRVADALAAGAGKAQGDVSDLGMALKQGGLVASQFGLGMEETVGTLSMFAEAGLLGSDAGTSFKSMLLALANPSKKAAGVMEDLGIAAYDAQGQFVGISGLAEQLKTQMQDLDPATRQAALATIFGTDAIRAAAILYENGAEGAERWAEAVSDSGFAAEQAATMQDNLRGDLEKLGGSIETLMIVAGEGANGPLRGLVQGLGALVDVIAGMDPGLLSAIALGLGAVGTAALITAGIMKAVTAWSAYRAAMASLATESPRTARAISGAGKALGAVGKVAGGAAIALAGIQIAGAIANQMTALANGADEVTAAFIRLDQGTGGLDRVFQRVDGSGISSGVTDLASAIERLGRADEPLVKLEDALNGLAGVGSITSDITEQFRLMDAELVRLDPQQAARNFTVLRDAFKAQGRPVEELLALFPQYAGQMQKLAAANGQGELSGNLLADAMEGVYPPLVDATLAAEDLATGQEKAADAMGKNARAAAVAAEEMEKVTEAQRAAADGALRLSGSAMGLEAAFDAATEAIRENGATHDITSEKGRANQQALDDIASSARSVADAMVENGVAVEDVNAKTAEARDVFLDTAAKMGYTAAQAQELADRYGLIPRSVTTVITATDQATTVANAIVSRINKMHASINVRARVMNANGLHAEVASGGLVGDVAYRLAGGGQARRDYTSGGPVKGPGTSTSDSVAAWLSDKEFVLNAWATERIGIDRLYHMNRYGELPAFRDGGQYQRRGRDYAASASLQAATANGGGAALPSLTQNNYGVDAAELARRNRDQWDHWTRKSRTRR